MCRTRAEQSTILNILPATVEAIQDDRGPSVLIRLVMEADRMVARVIRRSVRDLALKKGDELFVQIKSVAVRHSQTRCRIDTHKTAGGCRSMVCKSLPVLHFRLFFHGFPSLKSMSTFVSEIAQASEISTGCTIIQYMERKTEAADRGSKARRSLGNLYALYVPCEAFVRELR